MNTETLLIKLCRAFLSGEQITLDDGTDYDALYKLAKVHNLCAVVFCVLNTAQNKDNVPAEMLRRFNDDFLDAVVRYDFQSAQIAEIDALCEKDGIHHVFFKGSELRELFPVPEARVMSDVDMLIGTDDRDRLKKLLTSNGFDCRNSNGNVYEYTKDGLLTEVHTKIISGKVGESALENAFSDAIRHASFDGTRGRLNDDYHLSYLIAHLAHHFWFYGAGVKMILDIAVMLKKSDPDRVIEMLRDAKLDEFAKTVFTITYKWFGVGRDFSVPAEKAEEFLLSYGAFGNASRNKAAVVTRKAMESGGTGGGFGTRLRLLFPSYENVRNIPYIRFIDGRPYLLPAAWVYRFYYNFRNRRDFVHSATDALGSDETKKAATDEIAFFKEIGLL